MIENWKDYLHLRAISISLWWNKGKFCLCNSCTTCGCGKWEMHHVSWRAAKQADKKDREMMWRNTLFGKDL